MEYRKYPFKTRQGVEDMSYGKMKEFIDIVKPKKMRDKAGFLGETQEVVVSVRAYKEGRHASEKWANRATFSEATDLFRFRVIPNVTITNDMSIICNGSNYEITSIEDVKGKGMYIEVLAKKVEAVNG